FAGLRQPGLWRLRAGSDRRVAARHADRTRAVGPSVTRSDHPDIAAVAGDGMAAACDDHLRPWSALGVLPGVPRRVLSDPREYHFRRALGRAAAVRGGCDARLQRVGAILSRRAARSTTVHLYRNAAWTGL